MNQARTKRFCNSLLCILASYLFCTTSFAVAQKNENRTDSYTGNWALILPDGAAGWLTIIQTNEELEGELWAVGGGKQLHNLEIKDGKLSFSRKIKVGQPAYEGGPPTGERVNCRYSAEVKGDLLLLTMHRPLSDGKIEDLPLTGKRMPPVPPQPDLSEIQFGEPISLFNGKNLDGWRLTNPRQTNGWKVANEKLVNSTEKLDFSPYSHFGNLRTDKEFDDFQLHIEFKVLSGGNSGIYLRGCYEVQVLDRDSRMQGIQGVGAIFGRVEPTENAGTPGGVWNTYDITLVDRHATVILNGKKVIDNQPIAGCTNGALHADVTLPGPIYLQGDHTSVSYRNIVIRPRIEKTEELVSFEENILPIFEDRCIYCHGEDEQESGLRLDRRIGMLKGGDSGLPAVVPGEPQQSYLLEVVKHLDPDLKMPPEEDKIPAKEIELLEKWIQEGAVWPGQMEEKIEDVVELWSFRPVVRPKIPSLELQEQPDNPVDAFLLEKLATENLTFSVSADPRSLLRRASIILTGLPPTLEESKKFLADFQRDPDNAYESLVDRLLSSPHFGERWAQHWLDVIRWAETNGSEANLYRKNAWVYRDYVIRSFNADKPYDQFLREQIAGDSMGVGEATGFLVAGPHVPAATVGREPSAIRQARADRMDEIMQTVGASMMGVTIGCARCHNHKFDPITIKDYYSLTAVFQDIEFGSRQPEYFPDHPLRIRGAELWKEIAAERNILKTFGGWEENWGAYRELHFAPATTKSIRIRFKMPNIFMDELEVLGPHYLNQNLALDTRGTKVSGFPHKGFENRNPIERLNDGQYGTMIWRAKVDQNSEERPWVRFDFEKPETINRLRLSNNREYFYGTDYLDRKPNLPRYEFDVDILDENGEWKPWVGTWGVNKKLAEEHPERKTSLQKIQKLIQRLLEEGPRPSFVGHLIEPAPTYVLLRGSPENPRNQVAADGPTALNGDLNLKIDAPGPARRAAFAEWISDVENPLAARVMVNRIWHHIFGTGLVSTTSDFGKAGAIPTHPELLDWLAAEFVEPTRHDGSAWSTKSMIRLLLLSDAFKQASQPQEEGLKADADSRLLWRFPPRRVEAEVIRDSILRASGKLNLNIGGRSYRIHNEKKTYAQWEVIDNHGQETWRRMIYQERMRRVDDQLFTAFDFPDCGQVRAKRPVSTTPLQALNLMNSDFVIEQSELIAERARENSNGEKAQAIEKCFQYLVGRLPSDLEKKACLEITQSGDLPLVCRAIINSNEFAFLP